MARGGSRETAGAAVARRILSFSRALYCPALGVRILSLGGFVFRLLPFFPVPSVSVSGGFFLPGHVPPGVWVVIPVARGGFALRSPYDMCQCWGYQSPQRTSVRGRMNQPVHEWMCARMNEDINKPPNQPLYRQHQTNTKTPMGRTKTNKRSRSGSRFLF